MDKIFGGKGEFDVDWGQLERLMSEATRMNRYDDVGMFSGTKWTEGPDGKWTRERTVNPEMQQGLDRMMARASGGQGMGMPDQMNSLMNGMMMNQMQRRGWENQHGGDTSGWGAGYGQQMNPPPPPPQEGGYQLRPNEPNPGYAGGPGYGDPSGGRNPMYPNGPGAFPGGYPQYPSGSRPGEGGGGGAGG